MLFDRLFARGKTILFISVGRLKTGRGRDREYTAKCNGLSLHRSNTSISNIELLTETKYEAPRVHAGYRAIGFYDGEWFMERDLDELHRRIAICHSLFGL